MKRTEAYALATGLLCEAASGRAEIRPRNAVDSSPSWQRALVHPRRRLAIHSRLRASAGAGRGGGHVGATPGFEGLAKTATRAARLATSFTSWSLEHHLTDHEGQAGDVAARPSKTGDEPVADRSPPRHDEGARWSPTRRPVSRSILGDDDAHTRSDEVGGKLGRRSFWFSAERSSMTRCDLGPSRGRQAPPLRSARRRAEGRQDPITAPPKKHRTPLTTLADQTFQPLIQSRSLEPAGFIAVLVETISMGLMVTKS